MPSFFPPPSSTYFYCNILKMASYSEIILNSEIFITSLLKLSGLLYLLWVTVNEDSQQGVKVAITAEVLSCKSWVEKQILSQSNPYRESESKGKCSCYTGKVSVMKRFNTAALIPLETPILKKFWLAYIYVYISILRFPMYSVLGIWSTVLNIWIRWDG